MERGPGGEDHPAHPCILQILMQTKNLPLSEVAPLAPLWSPRCDGGTGIDRRSAVVFLAVAPLLVLAAAFLAEGIVRLQRAALLQSHSAEDLPFLVLGGPLD